MKNIQLTCAHALVKFLTKQKILIDGKKEPLFPGAFGIFGHGNVACLGQALQENQKELPTWRGHHEQNMALTGIAYSRAKRRKQIFIATSSVGPGSTNMITAAAVAMSNRLPILFLPGDTFANRMPDPVLQQVEHFSNPGITQNDGFKPVVRYFDRITRPEQIISSLQQAIQIMLDPADCGPACISLSQDVQGEVYDYPEEFFKERVHTIRRPRPDDFQIKEAAELIKKSKKPIIIAGGGVFYSDATDELSNFAKKHNIKFQTYTFKNSLKDELKVLQILKKKNIKIICLAGFMKILSKEFIKRFKGKIINIHPSLLPKYKGLDTHNRAINNNDKYSGCTVHYVTPKLDSGKIILQKKVKIFKNDNAKSLQKRILKQEHKIYPKALKMILN